MTHVYGTGKTDATAAKPNLSAVNTDIHLTQRNIDDAEKKVAAAVAAKQPSTKEQILRPGDNPISRGDMLMDMSQTPVQWMVGFGLKWGGVALGLLGIGAQKIANGVDAVANPAPVDTTDKFSERLEDSSSIPELKSKQLRNKLNF